jgi:hypothetical protein
MDRKVIHIIGGGLYGALTAYMFAKYKPEFKIRLFENSNRLLSAFDSIEIGGSKLNNGFHGIELSRSKELFNFFKEVLELDFYKQFNHRGLVINGEVLSFLDKKCDWPEELQNHIIADLSSILPNNYDISSIVSLEYENLIREVSKRYTDNFEDVKGLFIPWFLPSDVIFESKDEGDIYRNQVRSGEIISEYGFPKSELFEIIQSKFLDVLETMNVEVVLNAKVKFTSMGVDYYNFELLNEKPDKIYFCASPALIIKDLDLKSYNDLLTNKKFLYNALLKIKSDDFKLSKRFTEIISLDKKIPQLGRISFPKLKNSEKETYVQLELFVDPALDVDKLSASLESEMTRILSLKETELIELIDIKSTRTLYFPNHAQKEFAFNKLKEILTKYESKVFVRNIFGPINMAKTWLFAEENINLI